MDKNDTTLDVCSNNGIAVHTAVVFWGFRRFSVSACVAF